MQTKNISVITFELAKVMTIIRDDLGVPDATGHLMGRDRLGIPIRKVLLERLRRTRDGATLVVDLDGIPEMTLSVAEELGPLLFEEFLHYRQTQRKVFLAYCNLSDEIIGGFSKVFRPDVSAPRPPMHLTAIVFRRFAAGVFLEPRFIGEAVPDALRDVLEIIYAEGEVTSGDLDRRGIPAPSRKLNELYREYEWLLRQTRRTAEGIWQNVYSPIVPVKYESGETN